MRYFLCVLLAALIGCGGASQNTANVVHGTLGGLYGACQEVDVPNATWRSICAAVDAALPFVGALGAGTAELPPATANRPVTLTFGEVSDE